MIQIPKRVSHAGLAVITGLAIAGCPIGGGSSAPDPSLTPSVSIDDQLVGEVDTQTVVVDSATLPDGGFIAIIAGFSGELIGASFYREAGTVENIAISLDTYIEVPTDVFAQIHHDTNENLVFDFDDSGDPDGPYTSDGTPVRDSAVVSVQTNATTSRSPSNEAPSRSTD